VGEAQIGEPVEVIQCPTPHHHRHAVWQWARDDRDLELLATAVRWVAGDLHRGQQAVGVGPQTRIELVLQFVRPAGWHLGHVHLLPAYAAQAEHGLRPNQRLPPAVDQREVQSAAFLHPHVDLAQRREREARGRELQSALADAHLIDVAGKAVVKAAHAVPDAQCMGPCHDALSSGEGCRPAGGTVGEEPPGAFTVVGEGQVSPLSGLELERLGDEALRLRPETEAHVHRPPAGAARRAECPLVVIVRDVLLVHQEGFWIPLELGFGAHPHLEGESAGRAEIGRALHCGLVRLVLHRVPAEGLETAAEATGLRNLCTSERRRVSTPRAVLSLRSGVELPERDDMVTCGVVTRVGCLVGLRQLRGVSPLLRQRETTEHRDGSKQ